ncbi:SsrA-binding protein SmpB [Buchnera aphidicola (Thelaxes californica)]|uniref:SsrA-binding protein n=1 Tax=Buchnera aphidicola (Thelaxes californica) TaxID=1315998 RepID=A0A4D6YJN4_9GAMM|nr:SsrA-binding protein SmpB [Buchnera aphidicola]QCI26731.1 SsrA-binding protein SmpB [Buchnera aphidicola (Thelaxes californica)]
MKKKKNIIVCQNRKINHNFFVEKTFESGLLLQGWEIKSVRAKKVSIHNSYISFIQGEAYLFGANFQPVHTIFLHKEKFLSNRNRKLLLHKKELNYLNGKIHQLGYTVLALSILFRGAWCKLVIGVAKGKKNIDKRKYEKEKEWKLTQSKLMKNKNKYNIK